MALKAVIFNFILVVFFVIQGCSTSADPKPVTPPADAEFAVANILQSNMVVQRDKPFNIWGRAKSGRAINIIVSWNTEKFSTVADNGGNWKVVIPATPANINPQTITINPKGETAVTLSNILIGDVWICSGQSNMTMPLAPGYNGSFRGVIDYETEIAAANYPLIRELFVEPNSQNFPATVLSNPHTWNICSPAVAGNISAVAFYFARKIQTETNVPIGIITAAMNGTRCQLWANNEVFNDSDIKATYGGGESSTLYNGMINPLTGLGIKGFLWYQGESNWGDGPAAYAKLNAGLIKGWRDKFNQGVLPFYFVQLAPFAKDHNNEPGGGDLTLFDYALFREGQKKILELVPQTGMALTIDVGEVTGLHPRNKKPIGERLALYALKNDYGKAVEPLGPTYKSHTQNGKLVTIQFNNAAGLTTAGGEPLAQQFYIAGDAGVFVNAPAVIQGNTIVLTIPDGVTTVRYVRYAFTNAAVTNLQNANSLPVEQFRTDNW
ncbi:MAG: hypothetical protein EOP47_15165 [Sphingobacteriaceae bacterium]|nr:MAG: hypothetical protein EOP47_15165 [Sphingobacteriaceae bacterium]